MSGQSGQPPAAPRASTFVQKGQSVPKATPIHLPRESTGRGSFPKMPAPHAPRVGNIEKSGFQMADRLAKEGAAEGKLGAGKNHPLFKEVHLQLRKTRRKIK